MSDAGPDAGPERRVQGVLSLDILDVPGRPGRPLPDGVTHDSKVPMSWAPAVANGAPVTGYEVRDDHGKVSACGSFCAMPRERRWLWGAGRPEY